MRTCRKDEVTEVLAQFKAVKVFLSGDGQVIDIATTSKALLTALGEK
ncbi:protein of unknown function [Maridesulfovibrio hydrothermalis AM13 = DSM 14728]|uniref:Uncharacterized protein n=1 Tax=Maridesulfovibrio hydrothermalis AM13 = DSM 14728 TaxID=1121451 RepID=L0R7H5_9BACT|nr:protein of unknown function [Maridesulfovibrio hydrothermalis AM13 = DSM 14728]